MGDFKFSHIADSHIGGWRDERMKNISMDCFRKAIEISLERNVDFILLAGDLFNTSIPSVDHMKEVVKVLKLAMQKNVPIYTIAGSHDFSPSGKTIIEVLDKAGLLINVAKGSAEGDQLKLHFTTDRWTKSKITGLIGKKGGLEKNLFAALEKESLEAEDGYKIFMFHTAITEIKPAGLEKMDSSSISSLPRNFNYYAGGHVHYVYEKEMQSNNGNSVLTYPGPTFPNSFKELEELKKGTFWIVDVDRDGSNYITKPELISIPSPEVVTFNLNVDGKNPLEINELLFDTFKGDFDNKIITLRIHGTIQNGKISEIEFKKLMNRLYDVGAYYVTINTAKLKSKEFQKYRVDVGDAVDLEQNIIEEHSSGLNIDFLSTDKHALVKNLISSLNTTRKDGEKVATFEDRIVAEVSHLLELK